LLSRDSKYDPYEDKSIHITHTDTDDTVDSRNGFNDVINHYDNVNGFHYPKTTEQIPRSIRTPIRWIIIIGVTLGLGTMLVGFVYNLIETFK
jgi:hypothetical protein